MLFNLVAEASTHLPHKYSIFMSETITFSNFSLSSSSGSETSASPCRISLAYSRYDTGQKCVCGQRKNHFRNVFPNVINSWLLSTNTHMADREESCVRL